MLTPTPNSHDADGASSPLADPSRWAELIEGVRPDAFLVVIASSMGKNLREHCSPEDIWQDTLAQAWNAREAYRWQGSAAFRAWLFEIARNWIRSEKMRSPGDSLRKLGPMRERKGER